MTAKEKRGAIIGGLAFIGLGIAMIVHPDLAEGAEASGRHALLKTIIVWMWGIPGGIVAILLGSASVWSGIKAIKGGAKTPDAGGSQN
jgi:hypothetical protein